MSDTHQAAGSVRSVQPDKPGDWRLKSVVFVAGAVLMGLEMTGSRVLAIHFGSSIYVWGAIIGIFLAALSIGYYSGGQLADRRPTFTLLGILLLAAGCWLLLIPLYANLVCRLVLALDPGERLGPLIATAVLFGGPSILLGMVSPYAVRLAARTVETIGNVAGRLHALSAFGSIAGTLMTAFWLIPAVGVRALLQILGLCLLVLPLLVIRPSRRTVVPSLSLVLLVVSALVLNASIRTQVGAHLSLVYETDSPYHYIQVVDDRQRKVRYLRFNNYIEGAISLDPPFDTRMPYTNAFELARIFKPDLKRILMIGGGGGIGARKFVADDQQAVVDLVEIDSSVVDLSFRYFHLQPSDRLRVHVTDGRSFVRRATRGYDLVILDAFTIGGQIPFHLTTREFMGEIENLLTTDGVVLANINGAMSGPRSRILRSEFKTLATVFDCVHVFPQLSGDERLQSVALDLDHRRRNVILMAANGACVDRDSIVGRALRWPAVADHAAGLLTRPLPTDDVPVLTDDHAPVDTMVF